MNTQVEREGREGLSLDVDEENPWVGLHEFTEDIQQYFNGRGQETENLIRMVRRKNLTVLFGQSGLGKSSLLQAGLFTRARAEGYLPVYIRLSYSEDAGKGLPTLRDQVKNFIGGAIRVAIEKGALCGTAAEAEPRVDETLWEYLHRRDHPLRDPEGNPVSPVLAFDQFEELFTLGPTSQVYQSGGRAFLKELADCIENRIPKEISECISMEESERGAFADLDFSAQSYRVVIALREDYVAYLDDLSGVIPSVMENRMRLLPLNGRQALEAVLNPGKMEKDGKVVRQLIRPSAARRIVRFVAASKRNEFGPDGEAEASDELDMEDLRVDPALLSMVCRELNKKRIEAKQGEITTALLTETNKTILADFYAKCFEDPDIKPAQVFIEDSLLTASDFRDSVDIERAKSELGKLGVRAPERAIERLVNQRLLRIIERRSDTEPERLELAHDVLTGVVSESRRQRHLDEKKREEERIRAERDAQILRESEKRRRDAEERARESEANRLESMRRLRNARKSQAVTVTLLLLAIGGLAWGWYAQNKLNEEQKQASMDNYRYAIKKADTYFDKNGDTVFIDPAEGAKAVPAGDILAEARGHQIALTHLARALELDPENQDAALLACHLMLENQWCPPLTPEMGDPEAEQNSQKAILCATWTPAGDLAALTKDGRLLVADRASGVLKSTGTLSANASYSYAAFSASGRWLLTVSATAEEGSNRGQVWTWDDKAGVYNLEDPDKEGFVLKQDFRGVTWSIDGRVLVIVAMANPAQSSLWTRSGPDGNGGFVESATGMGQGVMASKLASVDFSPDGKYAVAATLDSSVAVWNVGDLGNPNATPVDGPRMLKARDGSSERIITVAFNPDAAKKQFLAVTFDHGVHIFTMGESSQVDLPLERERDRIVRACYSPDGNWVATATITGLAELWSVADIAPKTNPAPGTAQRPITKSPACEPIYHEGSMISFLGFKPGTGPRQFFTGEGPVYNRPETLRVWDARMNQIPHYHSLALADKAPAWLPELAQAVTGQELTAHGYEATPASDVVSEVQKEFSADGSEKGYSDFGNLFFGAYGVQQ